jgi:3-(3-hydroxy-phenyl)propionate hydroxylase
MFDVAIIGGGPVGAFAANLLGKAGIKTLIVEKEAQPFPLPRAVHLDHEMVRLLQAVGIADKVLADMRDTEGHLHIGADHGVIRYMGTVDKPRPYGWSNDYFFYQPELEDHLRDALGAYPNVELRLGTECVGVEQQSNHVSLNLVGDQQAYQIEARWVIACDGARSSVRKDLGIELDDLDFEEPWLVVDAEVDGDVQFPDLNGVPAGANLQQLSIMMCDPKRPATIVPGRGNHRRWELMLLPGENDKEMMKPQKVAELLAPYLDGVPHKIVRASTYRFHGLVAKQWQQGKVFLAGDAAHQTPPFFGQGMCHGFRDVANLSWKMAMILNHQADASILDSYQPERDPHVRAVITAAVNAGRYICILDQQQAAFRDADIREKVRRNELPTTAAELIPPIQSGIVATRTTKAGVRFIQPRLTIEGKEKLLDDIAPGQWKLFVKNGAILTSAQDTKQSYLTNVDLQIYNAEDLGCHNPITQWLADCQVQAVLVRPDFYVYGTAGHDVDTLLISLSQQLSATNTIQEQIA